MFPILDIRNTWEKGTITYIEEGKPLEIYVAHVPGTHKRVAMDQRGDFYVHNTKEGRWSRSRYGIFELERMLWEMLITYGREVPTLHEARTLCQQLAIDFMPLRAETSADLASGLQQTMQKIITPLRRVRDEDKKEARRAIVFCLPLRDSRNRVNMGAFRACTTKATDRFCRRIATTHSIEPHVACWLGAVRPIARSIACLVKTIEDNLEKALGAIERNDTARATGFIDAALGDVAQLTVRPLLRNRKYIRPELERTKTLLARGKNRDARRELMRSVNGIHLKRVRIRLEALLFRWVTAEASGEPTRLLLPALTEIRREFKTIDGTGFSQPVPAEVERILANAQSEWRAGDTKKTKELLRTATRML